MFADRAGHVIDTPANRAMIQGITRGTQNLLGVNNVGNQVFAQILPDGSQIWAYVRNGVIQNGGLNLPGAVRTLINGVFQ